MTDSSSAVLATGLAKLGLIESPEAMYDCSTGAQPRQCLQVNLYYMHGIGHGIGLEVHDPEQFYYMGKIQPGSAFTIEPGIYVREHVLEEMPDTPKNREIAAKLKKTVDAYKNTAYASRTTTSPRRREWSGCRRSRGSSARSRR